MKNETNEKRLTRWLLTATVVLLGLVLGLQLWQMFGGKNNGDPRAAGSGAAGPESAGSAAASVSQGKAAMIEDVQILNPDLPFDGLAGLSADELEQLWETGAPGLPIGASAAAAAAEEYAGTLEVDAVTTKTDPELDENPAHYEVELRHPVWGDFEYKIDAYTGEVLEGTPDLLQSLQAASATVPDAPADAPQTPAPQPPAASAQTPASGGDGEPPAASGEEAAKAAAFAHAGVSAADASVVHCKLEREDGRQVYDIGFWVGDTEYDYEVDAATGAILEAKQEEDHRRTGKTAQQTGSFIGEESAKTAAFTHAGVSGADAGRVEWELDEDDGQWIYEIEFHVGATEYDYEIAAADGTVLKAKRET